MSQAKANRIRQTLREGLASANRGNPFWTRRDAMQALALNYNTTK